MPDNIKYKNSFYQLKKDLESKIVLLDGAMGTMIMNSDDFGEKNITDVLIILYLQSLK